jgi:hypothetical protein
MAERTRPAAKVSNNRAGGIRCRHGDRRRSRHPAEPLGEASAGIDLFASAVAFGPFVHAGTGGANRSYVGYGLEVLARF